jgi:molybdopterin converting factor small subunit
MSIEVLLFGPAAEAAKTDRLPVPIEAAPVTCVELRQQLAAQVPALSKYLPSSRFAVNHSFVSDTHAIQPGDEVALIGLVSGG